MIRTFLIFYSCVAGLFLLGYLLSAPVWKRPTVLELEYAQLAESGEGSPLQEAFCLPELPGQHYEPPALAQARSQLSAAGLEIAQDGLHAGVVGFITPDLLIVSLEAPLSTHQQMFARIIEHGGKPSPQNTTRTVNFEEIGFHEFLILGQEEWSPIDLLVKDRILQFKETTSYHHGREELTTSKKTTLTLEYEPSRLIPPSEEHILKWRFPYAAWPLLLVVALVPTVLLMLLRKPITRALRIAQPPPARS